MMGKKSEKFVQNLLKVMPGWHSKLVRPFKDTLNREMSLETYYCLQTLRMNGTMSMTQLAEQLKVPKQQVTKLIDALCSHQFVNGRIMKKTADPSRSALPPRLYPTLTNIILKIQPLSICLKNSLPGKN